MKTEHEIPVRCLREENPKGGRNFNIHNEFAYLREQKNKKPWTREKGYYHPSSVKGCKRSMYYDRIGTDPIEMVAGSSRMYMDMGHSLHDLLQGYFSEIPGFEPEVKIAFPPLNIYGHCDGVFWNHDWLLEIKTIGESGYGTLVKPAIAHIWQIHCYMFALDIPRTQLLYLNRNSGATRLFKIKFSNEIWEEVTKVLGYVEDHVERKEPPPKEVNYNCKTCKFQHECKPF
tara:strand:- start:3299 stop:3988 length:690 start_codon:yes stop_codon:yes gene_type:complete